LSSETLFLLTRRKLHLAVVDAVCDCATMIWWPSN
jgi:hypothetical protein